MKLLLAMIPAFAVAGLASWLFITVKPRSPVAEVGSDLVRKDQVSDLYRYSLKATRCLEWVLHDDRMVPTLSDEVRAEAERLVKAFYNDKGD